VSAAPLHTALVVETRGIGSAQSVESVHYGSVAVVDAAGTLLWSAGDPNALTFSRSTLKPYQALPFVEAGGPAAFGFAEEEVALMCASHSGEDRHVALADALLAKAGCTEKQLQCGCHVPLRFTAFDKQPPARSKFDQRYNNCSGKHAGFLAYCRMTETPLESYLDEGHPLQRAIRATTARIAGIEETSIAVGIDGCSAPNLALPLDRLARLYALLARPEQATEAQASLATLADAMSRHPEIVSGEGRSDLHFVQAFKTTENDSDVVAKIGAGGVQLFGVRSTGIGIAIKVADGHMPSLYCTAVTVLDQLGLLDDTRRSALSAYARPPIRNHRGTVTGELRSVLALERR
jgi:L-asparaginase II